MNHTLEDVEIVNSHLKVAWLYDHQIAVFTVDSLHPSVIDAWAERWIALLKGWDATKTLYCLNDYTGVKNFTATSQLRRRSKELTLVRQDVRAKNAICIPKSMVGQVTQIFINALPQLKVERVRRMFFSADEGLAWLEAEMEKEKQAGK
jgi:hypothetical protein